MCNIKFRKPEFFPIFFHGLSRYDVRLFFTALNKFDKNPITAIPQNTELYISFNKHIGNPNADAITTRQSNWDFWIHSGFHQVAWLRPDQFQTLSSVFPNFRDLNIYRKGVFPYEYFDSPEKLQQTSLPPKRCFYSKLKNEFCSLQDYRYALKLWWLDVLYSKIFCLLTWRRMFHFSLMFLNILEKSVDLDHRQ